jgi:hypothetical protein
MLHHRISAALLTTALTLSLAGTGTAYAATADTALGTIRALGIMVGDDQGNLNLSSHVTRAQFVTMMTAASSYKDTIGSGSGVSLYKDVKSSYWGSEYIKLAVEQSWMTGYTDGTFRPDRTITLEEACTALLRLLGYDPSTMAGSFPTAQLTKAKSVGLLDDVTAVQGQTLTRQDCVTLFYNLLLCNTNGGNSMAYGSTLGYTIKNGEVDYSTLVSNDTKGPYVAESSGAVTLPFSTSGLTVYRDGVLSSLSAVQRYDVYYYNANLRTLWVYTDRVTGTLTALSPSKTSPTSATVAGVNYTIGTSAATYKLSSQGQFATGDLVTLLLGMNGEVVDVISAAENETVYYGVVVSSSRSASTSDTASSGTSGVQVVTKVASTDGTVYTFYHDGTVLSSGSLVTVTLNQSGTTVKRLSAQRLSGSVNASGTAFAGYSFADNVEILDTDSNGGYAKIYPSRLAGCKLTSDNVSFYTLNGDGEIDRLVLSNATGDTYTYVYLTDVETSTGQHNVSGRYEYLLNGMTQSFSSSNAMSVSTGGAALIYDNGTLKSMRQLSSVALDGLSDLYATSGNQQYTLSEDVQILMQDTSTGGGYFLTTLSQINASDYQLKGWYDNIGCSAGGRIRIIVATK